MFFQHIVILYRVRWVKRSLFFIHLLLPEKLSIKIMVKLIISASQNRKSNCRTYSNVTIFCTDPTRWRTVQLGPTATFNDTCCGISGNICYHEPPQWLHMKNPFSLLLIGTGLCGIFLLVCLEQPCRSLSQINYSWYSQEMILQSFFYQRQGVGEPFLCACFMMVPHA